MEVSEQERNQVLAVAAILIRTGAAGGPEASCVKFDAQVVGFCANTLGQQGVSLANVSVTCAGVLGVEPTLETLRASG